MFEALSEGVNGWAMLWGAMVSFSIGLVWMWKADKSRPMRPIAVANLILAVFSLAWVVGLMERRQAFFEAVLIVMTIAAFVGFVALTSGKTTAKTAVDVVFVFAAGFVMFIAQFLL